MRFRDSKYYNSDLLELQLVDDLENTHIGPFRGQSIQFGTQSQGLSPMLGPIWIVGLKNFLLKLKFAILINKKKDIWNLFYLM